MFTGLFGRSDEGADLEEDNGAERTSSNRTTSTRDIVPCYGDKKQSWKRTTSEQTMSLPSQSTDVETSQVCISCVSCMVSCLSWGMVLPRARWRIQKILFPIFFLHLASKQNTQGIVPWQFFQMGDNHLSLPSVIPSGCKYLHFYP